MVRSDDRRARRAAGSSVHLLIAGATGVIGRRIMPLLVARGHEVSAVTRRSDVVDAISRSGASQLTCNVYESNLLADVVGSLQPDIVMAQLTDLPDSPEDLPQYAEANARMRRVGVRNLLRAAQIAGCPRVLVQSVAWDLGGDAAAAVDEMEEAVLSSRGVILRYGRFYGPETYSPGELPEPPRIHIDQAAMRTVEYLDAGPGIVEIFDA